MESQRVRIQKYYFELTAIIAPAPSAMSAPTTATASRSPSPLTPEPSDSLEVNIQSDFDLSSSWYHSTKMPPWASDPSVYSASHKPEEDHMLRLDDLIEQHAYDEYVILLLYSPLL